MVDVEDNEKYNAALAAISEEQRKRGFGSLGLSPDDGPYSGEPQSVASFMLTCDYRAVRAILKLKLDKEGSLTPHELAALAFSHAMTGDDPTEVAKDALSKDPLLPAAYAALSVVSGSDGSPHRLLMATRFATLMSKCCDPANNDPWLTYTMDKLSYHIQRLEPFIEKLSRLIYFDERRKTLLAMFPELIGNEQFESLVADLKANPDMPSGQFLRYPVFCELLENICRDISPEVIMLWRSDADLKTMASTSEAPIARLSVDVLGHVSRFLTLNDIGTLRNTTRVMTAMFDHWTVWRSQHLRVLDVSPEETDSKLFWGPIDELEWKSLVKIVTLVHRSLAALKVEDMADLTAGLEDQCFPSEKARKVLRDLNYIFRAPISPVSDFESPEIICLWMWQCMNVYHRGGIMTINNALDSLISLSQFVTPSMTFNYGMSYLLSIDLFSSYCWLRPNVARTLNKFGYGVAVQSTKFRAAGMSYALSSVLAWRNLLPERVQVHPLNTSNSHHRRHPRGLLSSMDLSSSSTALHPDPHHVPHAMFGGIGHRTSISGVYRLLFNYSHAALEYERDHGIVEIVQDPVTLEVSGHGIDTLRGTFKVLDGRSSQRREADNARAASGFHQIVFNGGLIAIPSHMVIVYSDGTHLLIEPGDNVFSLGGTLSKIEPLQGVTDPDYSHAPAKVFGGFTLLYDHGITTAEGEARESLWKAEVDEISQKPPITAEPIPYRVAQYIRSQHAVFAPWNHTTETDYDTVNTVIIRYNEVISMLLTNPSYVDLLEVIEEFADRQRQPFPEIPTLVMNVGRETQTIYELRSDLWKTVVAGLIHTLANVIPYFMSKEHVSEINTRIQLVGDMTEADGEEAIADMQNFLSQVWEALRLHPNHRFLLTSSARFFHAALYSFPDSEEDGASFMNALGGATSSSSSGSSNRKSRSGGLMKWFKSPIGMIITAVSFSLSVGIAAFVAGRLVARSSAAK